MPPFSRPDALRWLSTRRDHHDRADWAIMRADDGAFFDGGATGRLCQRPVVTGRHVLRLAPTSDGLMTRRGIIDWRR